MTTLTRRLAGTLKVLFRAALNLSARGPHPPVLIEAGDDGYRIRCRTAEATIEYCTTDKPLPERMIVSFDLLSHCAANNDQPLSLEQAAEGVLARWQEGAVPQTKQFDALEITDETWPEAPESNSENPSSLISALRDACRFTDPNSARYALGCLQLTGEGRISSTNGKELLIQSGFEFPWEGEILLPVSKLFNCKQMPLTEPVVIGRTEEWLCIKVGFWTFQIRQFRDGRFPQVDDLIKSSDQATASFALPPSDREFLCQNLSRLPDSDTFNSPCTVDLNGKVVVRARAANTGEITELVLSGATRSGKAVRFNTNRNLLAHAIELGFEQVHLINANVPAYCIDQNRFFLWALLEPESALKPTAAAIQIESGTTEAVDSNHLSSQTRRTPMKTNQNSNHTTNPTNRPSPAPEEQREQEELSTIDQAIAVRDSLRSAASNVNDLVRVLKREKKQSRTLRSTLLSLRQLQAIDA